jgi:hypothetical protein
MLTRYLLAHQSRLHASDQEFAGILGLDPETWIALRSGTVGYSSTIIARILNRFPIALAAALDHLRVQQPAVDQPQSAAAWAPSQPARAATAVALN